MTVQPGTLRTVGEIVNSVQTLEGAVFLIRRPYEAATLLEEMWAFHPLHPLSSEWNSL